jgi:tetratricopeptide (TPR) repeat protein
VAALAFKALRLAVIGAAAAGAVWAAAVLFGRGGAIGAFAAVMILAGAILVWLPRAAHRAFLRGRHRRAMLYYRVLRRFFFDRGARASIDVSLGACALAEGDHERALALLARVDPELLGESARAAWLNNRGYALARSGDDPGAALESAAEAIALRPDVAGFRHTRGIALLALGRLDDAIRELDAVWREQTAAESTPLLEAERCYDLGVAWARKGERDYARDYFERAHRAAPDSTWAAQAARELDKVGAAPRPLDL